jgi:prefoldin subunit 5
MVKLLATARIERHIDAIERQIKEMRHSIKVYKSDPEKYLPQLQNLIQAATETANSSERILLAIGNFAED